MAPQAQTRQQDLKRTRTDLSDDSGYQSESSSSSSSTRANSPSNSRRRLPSITAGVANPLNQPGFFAGHTSQFMSGGDPLPSGWTQSPYTAYKMTSYTDGLAGKLYAPKLVMITDINESTWALSLDSTAIGQYPQASSLKLTNLKSVCLPSIHRSRYQPKLASLIYPFAPALNACDKEGRRHLKMEVEFYSIGQARVAQWVRITQHVRKAPESAEKIRQAISQLRDLPKMPVLAIDWSCYPVMYFVDPTAQFELKSINIQDLDYCVVQEPGGTQRRTSWQDFQKLERERHKYAYGYRPYLPYLDFNLAEGAKKPLAVLAPNPDKYEDFVAAANKKAVKLLSQS